MERLLALAGLSGSGKSRLMHELRKRHERKAHILATYTDRPLLDADVPGEYRYLHKDAFTELEEARHFLWTECDLNGYRYGITKESLDHILHSTDAAVAMLAVSPSSYVPLHKHVRAHVHDTDHADNLHLCWVAGPAIRDMLCARIKRRNSIDHIDDDGTERLALQADWYAQAREYAAACERPLTTILNTCKLAPAFLEFECIAKLELRA